MRIWVYRMFDGCNILILASIFLPLSKLKQRIFNALLSYGNRGSLFLSVSSSMESQHQIHHGVAPPEREGSDAFHEVFLLWSWEGHPELRHQEVQHKCLARSWEVWGIVSCSLLFAWWVLILFLAAFPRKRPRELGSWNTRDSSVWSDVALMEMKGFLLQSSCQMILLLSVYFMVCQKDFHDGLERNQN